MNNPEKYKELGGLTPSGILLDGEPGLGKTLMAKCFINASGRKSFTFRKDKPNGDFVNEIKKIYDEAKNNAPSIVFLDDMDKFANEDDRHKNAEEYITVQSCIDDMKGIEVFTIATTNEIENIPESLLRVGRFDKVFKVKSPKTEEAEKIVEYYLSKKKFVGDVDIKQVSKILGGCSCAQLETVINEASVLAGFEGKEKIEKEDLLRSAMCVIFNAPELAEKKPVEIVRKTAYHEAGHVVIAELLEPGSISLVSVLGHDGPTQGITAYYQDDDKYFSDIKYMKNRVISLLAGKATTEIVYGEVDVGANSDIHRAIDITERFVDHYCGFGLDKFEFQNNTSNDLLSRREMQVFTEL